MLYFYRPTINWGRRLELGANTYRVRVPPTSTEGRCPEPQQIKPPSSV